MPLTPVSQALGEGISRAAGKPTAQHSTAQNEKVLNDAGGLCEQQ